ncbi:hypothetical protein EMG79_27625 [Klebsiella pneumoniae]|uniref:DUF4309 domain-containing protein n=1 Tax=Paenibacillus antri TaxID=2582848 RepID=A0A5R9G2S1_9BACL|nr:hypothetical protein [Paenibacillus antri]TLS50121.1 hypothetical protein FE782_22585 [Paenibacillus antri]TMY74021.1 hypothetical protein EMG79_27625 [Klebsiella pneumoniae]
MRNIWIGLALAALLLSVGCGPEAAPGTPEETERPAEAMTPAEVEQQETPSEEAPLEIPAQVRLVTEAVRHVSPPEEMPWVRESFRLPFTLEVEEDATVYVQKVGSTDVFELAPHQAVIALQTLRLTKPSPFVEWLEEVPSGPKASIVIASGANAYETSFYYEKNVLSSATDNPTGTGYLYAYDTHLSLLLYELFEPKTAMGTVGAFYDALIAESTPSEGGVQTEGAVEPERLTVEGKDYLAWEAELSGAEPLEETSFVGFEGELEPMAAYDGGVLKLNLAYAFTEPGYATPDGIEVGTTREDVLVKLGAPNRALPDAWGYRIGDYFRFYLYFADDEVAAMLLTIPL